MHHSNFYSRYKCSRCGQIYSGYELQIYFHHLCLECDGTRFEGIKSPDPHSGNGLLLL